MGSEAVFCEWLPAANVGLFKIRQPDSGRLNLFLGGQAGHDWPSEQTRQEPATTGAGAQHAQHAQPAHRAQRAQHAQHVQRAQHGPSSISHGGRPSPGTSGPQPHCATRPLHQGPPHLAAGEGRHSRLALLRPALPPAVPHSRPPGLRSAAASKLSHTAPQARHANVRTVIAPGMGIWPP